ncbi:MAG: hypothetical protein AAGE89_06650 [Pseudomonadota bacterium]
MKLLSILGAASAVLVMATFQAQSEGEATKVSAPQSVLEADGTFLVGPGEPLELVTGLRNVIGQRLISICASVPDRSELEIAVGDAVSTVSLTSRRDGGTSCRAVVFPLNTDVKLSVAGVDAYVIGTYSIK